MNNLYCYLFMHELAERILIITSKGIISEKEQLILSAYTNLLTQIDKGINLEKEGKILSADHYILKYTRQLVKNIEAYV